MRKLENEILETLCIGMYYMTKGPLTDRYTQIVRQDAIEKFHHDPFFHTLVETIFHRIMYFVNDYIDERNK